MWCISNSVWSFAGLVPGTTTLAKFWQSRCVWYCCLWHFWVPIIGPSDNQSPKGNPGLPQFHENYKITIFTTPQQTFKKNTAYLKPTPLCKTKTIQHNLKSARKALPHPLPHPLHLLWTKSIQHESKSQDRPSPFSTKKAQLASSSEQAAGGLEVLQCCLGLC
jgi:hypothetical protein